MANRISSLDAGYVPGTLSVFPEALDNKSTLYDITNNAVTKLKQTLTFNTKVIIVDSTEGFPNEGTLRIGQEPGPELAGEFELWILRVANCSFEGFDIHMAWVSCNQVQEAFSHVHYSLALFLIS